jgi:hypothetical protein
MNEPAGKFRMNIWREMTILSIMVMDVSWVVLWLQIVSPPLRALGAGVIFLDLWGTVLIAHVIARLLNGLKLKKNLHRGIIVTFVLLCGWVNICILMSGSGGTQFTAFLTQPIEEVSAAGRLIPPEIWILAVTLALIWRGYNLAQSWGGRETVFNSLLWGIGFYAAYGVFSAVTKYTGALWLVYVFIAAALLAMVTARVSTLVRMRGGTHSPFDLRWLGSILAAAGIVTGGAVLVSGVVAQRVDQINGVFRFLIYGIITLLVLPIAYLLKLGEPAVQAVQGMVATPTPAPQIPAWEQGLETATGPEVINDMAEAGGGYGIFIQAILIGAACVVLLILVLRLASNWQLKREGGEDDEKQSLLEGTSLWMAIVNAVRNRLLNTADNLSAARLRRKEKLQAAARIRRIYADFMDLCDELGQSRPEPVTPLEFLPAAVEIFPNLDHDLDAITNSYLRVRYGELPETHQEVEMVEVAWKRLSEQGTLIKKQAQLKSKAG